MVSLIGVANSYPPIYVVMEFMEHGDLKSFLLREEGAALTNEVSLTTSHYIVGIKSTKNTYVSIV